MHRLLLALVALAAGLSAGEAAAAQHSSDIIPRTVNFLIFAAIIYYLVADPVKNFFKNRSLSIASKLEEVQSRLKLAKEEKEKALEELQKAKELAKEIAEVSEKEIEVIVRQIKEQVKEELANLEKMFEENIELERRKRIREITKEVLEELFEDKELALDKQKFISLIVKKVA